MSEPDIRQKLGLRPVINCSGTMTSLGASIVVPHAVETIAAVLSQWTEISELQRIASHLIWIGTHEPSRD